MCKIDDEVIFECFGQHKVIIRVKQRLMAFRGAFNLINERKEDSMNFRV